MSSDKDQEEELLNKTLDAYVESTGHLPGEDEMPKVVEIVEDYLDKENDG